MRVVAIAALLLAGCAKDLPETDWSAQRPVNVPAEATYVGKYSAERSLVAATNAVGALEVEDGSREAFEAGGRVVRFVPNVAGRVWVVSGQNGLVMLSEQLKKNDRLLVDPRGNRLRINGAEVYARRVGAAGDSDNPYVIYFLPEAAK